ncbi:MAG TPA: NADP-dependent oxidoreductase [Chthoniobacterales bacterium]|nr:NADP-dependent oxidoreductase [Chthoniobacterales bacterium]
MKAVRYDTFGGPEVLKYEDAPRPSPRAGELLVRVRAAGVNPVDAKVRAGAFGPGGQLPAIPGYDLAGVVEETGPEVTRFKKGDAIFAYLNLRRGGAYAQYAIVREDEAAAKPRALSFEEAAAVPLAALTAWQALVEKAKLDAGQTVLIHGGSGGVGSFAVQIAKARGAKVFATASTRNQETLKQLGVDQPIDYTTTKFEEVAKDVDVVLDTVAGETLARSYGVVKKGGIVVSILEPPKKEELAKRGIRGEVFLARPSAEMLGEVGKLIEAGKIKPVVSQVLPIAEAAKAHQQIETGHTRGKIVLKVE